MAAGAVGAGDKVEVGGVGWLEGRFQGRQTGVGDGPRRQAGMLIGVVAMGAFQIGAVQGAAVTVIEQGGVDGGRVALQAHLSPQAVAKDGGHERPLLG